ncbi:MFS transporter [Knoellia sp. p5-6-4]|uniref:MFS transporter n=1 Tax=unclassified Knoellia TaxID=2618719 RepID=UPI0023DB4458|nr:MFS transporter [Knoellia sp. p5-6-4]MDF2144651.1 MFS transporter [Knoellia sp. p5-6-4]
MTEQMAAQESTEAPTSRGLGRLLASTGVSIAGQGMVIAAVPLMAASLTRNPVGVSITVAATYAAWLIAGLPAGALVDRWSRRSTMVFADIVRAVLLGGFAWAIAAELGSVWLLTLVVFLVGVAGCFFDPAAQAAIPAVVGRDVKTLASANSRLWSLDLLGRSLLGPPLGAALFAVAAALPFGLNSGTFLISAALLAGLSLGRPVSESVKQASISASVAEGLRFLFRHRELRALTIGMATFNFVYNLAYATLVLFAQDRLGLDDRAFGLLLAMLAVGGLVAAGISSKLGGRASPLHIYAACLAAQALAWGFIVVVQRPVVAAAALVLVGMASMTATVIGAAARQSLTPDDKLGRVSAGTRAVGLGSGAVGALMGGWAAQVLGLGAPFLGAAVAATAAALWFALHGESTASSS